MVIQKDKIRVKTFRSVELLEAFLKSGEVEELVSYHYNGASCSIIYHEAKAQSNVQDKLEIKEEKIFKIKEK